MPTVTFAIDGDSITTDIMGNRALALSSAIYGTGNHTIALSSSSSSATITGPLYIDIQMVEVV